MERKVCSYMTIADPSLRVNQTLELTIEMIEGLDPT